MNPQFCPLQMIVTGGQDAYDVAYWIGRFGPTSRAPYAMGVLFNLAKLAREENQ